jgi:excisionase family DNA binding protein
MRDYIGSAEAARVIGCVDSRVRQLLRAGRLAGERVGRDWLVERTSAESYRDSARKPGPKTAPAKRQRKK